MNPAWIIGGLAVVFVGIPIATDKLIKAGHGGPDDELDDTVLAALDDAYFDRCVILEGRTPEPDELPSRRARP